MLIAGALLATGSVSVLAQSFPVTPAQRHAATQVSQGGVELSNLRSDAPETHTVKRGDTLWGISSLFLTSPWLWPQLWGMNLDQVRNPHLIYPGQQLSLDRSGGRARLRFGGPVLRGGIDGDPVPVVRISPEIRYDALGDNNALPTLKPHLIEPFLTEPLIVEEAAFARAPRIVATRGEQVLLAGGDRAYARSDDAQALIVAPGLPQDWRVFRDARPLRDPGTGDILGWEAHYLGKARLVRSEGRVESDDRTRADIVPATIDLVSAKEEVRVGDRLLPEPPRQLTSYAPHAPQFAVEGGRIVSVYGSAVVNAAQNQVVAINRGTRDGIESGHMLAILSDGGRIVDRTDPSRTTIRLPDERNGLLLVFRPFERISYALIVQTRSGVKVGDRLINPR